MKRMGRTLYARDAGRRCTYVPEPHSLKRLIDELSLSFPYVQIELHENLPSAVKVDAGKIERATSNIIINAIEAGSRKIKCHVCRDGANLEILISDDGPGVPPEIAENIFEKGFSHGKKGGTGLGLSYARMVANGHGGTITYDRKDALSVFRLSIPNAVTEESGHPPDLAGTAAIFDHQPEASSDPIRKPAEPKILVSLSDLTRARGIIESVGEENITNDVGQLDVCSFVLTDNIDLMEHCLQCQKRFLFDSSASIEIVINRLRKEICGSNLT